MELIEALIGPLGGEGIPPSGGLKRIHSQMECPAQMYEVPYSTADVKFVQVITERNNNMKQLRDALSSAKESLDEALRLAEETGDPGLYNLVDDALSDTESALEDLRDLVPGV